MPEAVQVVLSELDGLLIETEPARVEKRSRDFCWFSPILEERLAGVTADAVVAPTTTAELQRAVAACCRHAVPLTARGAGTGNCGQAMPLRGGLVVDMGYLDRVLDIQPGWCRAEAGCVVGVLDAALHERGQALRVHPSTVATATIGGFVAGGSGGVGSVTWGTLRDAGAVRALRVMTIEPEPRLLELRGTHVRLAVQGFGTTGLITEVELPTASAVRWLERVIGFADLEAALRFADALAHADAIVKHLVSVVAAPAPGRFLLPHGVDETTHVVMVMVAETAAEALDAVLAEHPGELLGAGSSPLYELAWNHTTWQALKHDRAWTYLEVAHPSPGHVDKTLACAHAFAPDEVIPHVEFVRTAGAVACRGLPLVRFTTAERLREIIAAFEALGCRVFNPHVFTLEEMRGRPVDPHVLAFKSKVDPKNLLNPGKLARFDGPRRRREDAPDFGLKSR